MVTSSADADRTAPVMRPVDTAVEPFLAAVADERRQADARALAALMAEVTGEPPALWGGGIVGFGSYHYRYESGREGDAPLVGFAPRKTRLVVYLEAGYEARYPETLAALGPHETGKGCLYLKRLADVDEGALRELVEGTVRAHRG
ncbi:DUF1801 domain-containing protein [Asanoa sp. NPDC049518]|uniref:DUF1801 domain-containing protein n=1 Tax=unclassified Asanoa TaxID=2685164 RepID=UPI003417C261